MNKVGRIIISIIFGACGLVLAAAGLYLLFEGPDLLQALEQAGMVLVGAALMAYGVAIALGMRVRDVIERVLLGTSTQ